LIAQEKVEEVSIKTNPVFFGDFSLGYTNGGIQGFSVTGSLNYQKKNLFTFRTLQVLHIERIDFLFCFLLELILTRCQNIPYCMEKE